jgi:hypothetical protein
MVPELVRAFEELLKTGLLAVRPENVMPVTVGLALHAGLVVVPADVRTWPEATASRFDTVP